jgi:hypothetical protein
MKFRPRFSLRTLFVLIALIAIPLGWSIRQLDWIRRRHEFLNRDDLPIWYEGFWGSELDCPWYLRLFGEHARTPITVKKDHVEEAIRLFPEALVYEDDNNNLIKRADPGNPPD